MNMKDWARETGIPYGTIYNRKVRQQLPDEECVKPIRKNKLIMWEGKERTISELAEIAGISDKAFRGRLHQGWNIEKIMNTPLAGSVRARTCDEDCFHCKYTDCIM